MLSKRADMRWRRTEEGLQKLICLQDQLLEAAASLVGPGGLLVYSTCSIEPEECAERVSSFLLRKPSFSMVRVDANSVPASTMTTEGHFQTLPHVHGCDGAFAAKMRRRAF